MCRTEEEKGVVGHEEPDPERAGEVEPSETTSVKVRADQQHNGAVEEGKYGTT